MPGTKEIRTKIASVKSTQKITKAMQMVATSKMRARAGPHEAGAPYAEKMRTVIGHLNEANPDFVIRSWSNAKPSRSASSSSRPIAAWPVASMPTSSSRCCCRCGSGRQGRESQRLNRRQQGHGVLPAVSARRCSAPSRDWVIVRISRIWSAPSRSCWTRTRRQDRPAAARQCEIREHDDAAAEHHAAAADQCERQSGSPGALGTTFMSPTRPRSSTGC